MQALEFESSVKGNTLEIPAHLMQRVSEHSRVKVIMLMEEELEKTSGDNLKQQLLAIGRRCAALPTLSDQTVDEILGYDEQGLPS